MIWRALGTGHIGIATRLSDAQVQQRPAVQQPPAVQPPAQLPPAQRQPVHRQLQMGAHRAGECGLRRSYSDPLLSVQAEEVEEAAPGPANSGVNRSLTKKVQ